jgi:UDP-3-O-[3-hydroxymyristoyl] glucosamine N-acyltransferase
MKFPKCTLCKKLPLLSTVNMLEMSIFLYGMNEIHVVEKGDIVFVDHPKYYTKALNSARLLF